MPQMKEKILLSAGGALVGAVNGLFGGGGGMLAVPLQTQLLGRDTKIAHATAILIILPVSLASGLVYLGFGQFDPSVGIPATIGVVLGGILGAKLLTKLSSAYVTLIFAIVMLAAGLKMML